MIDANTDWIRRAKDTDDLRRLEQQERDRARRTGHSETTADLILRTLEYIARLERSQAMAKEEV